MCDLHYSIAAGLLKDTGSGWSVTKPDGTIVQCAMALTQTKEYAHELIDRMAPGQVPVVVNLLEDRACISTHG